MEQPSAPSPRASRAERAESRSKVADRMGAARRPAWKACSGAALARAEVHSYRNVTQHTGDGGVGKSLLDLQLAVAVGRKPQMGRYAGEHHRPGHRRSPKTSCRETWRRVADIWGTRGSKRPSEACSLRRLPVWMRCRRCSSARRRQQHDADSTTAAPARQQRRTRCGRNSLLSIRPLTCSAATRSKRRQVRQFVGMFWLFASDFDRAVVLLSHPGSASGMMDGTDVPGPPGWNNAFRGWMDEEARNCARWNGRR